MQEVRKPQVTDCFVRNRCLRLWKRVVSVLVCIVVFCTTYALILPAITKEGTVCCGVEEHEHSDKCYKEKQICGQAETETTVHVHSSSCYGKQQKLVCGQEENATVHTHTENCIASEQNLICQNNDASHQHTAECYEVTESYICGFGEGEVEGHIHTDKCYKTEEVLQCGKKEGEQAVGHKHTDACYEKVLECEKEEHTHELGCYSDPEADVETAANWERTMEDVELTGDWAKDVIAIAESQLGYAESDRNYIVDKDGKSKKGYTRYGDWYGDSYGHWCAMFVSFCLNYAEIPAEDFPREASCKRWIEELKKEEYDFYREAKDYTPKEGDLIFFDWDKDEKSDHVGLVVELIEATETEPAQYRTIEGNADNCVKYVKYNRDDEQILGFAELPENPHPEKDADGENALPGQDNQGDEKPADEESTLPESDPKADVETAKDWEATLPDPIPEEWSEAVLAVAESQIGYRESEKNYELDEEGNPKGYTRYGAWSENPYGDWNAAFAAFCLHYAGVPEEVIPQSDTCPEWVEALQSDDYGFYRAKGEYTPKAGDLVFFDEDGDQIADRVGLAADFAEEAETTGENETAGEPETAKKNETEKATEEAGTVETGTEAEAGTEAETETGAERGTEAEGDNGTEVKPETESRSEAGGLRTIEGDSDDSVQYVTYGLEDSKILGYGELPEIEMPVMYAANEPVGASVGSDSANISLEHHKVIDSFGDGVNNPDTDLDNNPALDQSDLYRLYLDIVGKSEPIDVLFVLDQSSSMTTQDIKTGGTTVKEHGVWHPFPLPGYWEPVEVDETITRLEAVERVLNGYGDDEGLISYIFRQNQDNQVAVCTFDGRLNNLETDRGDTWETDSDDATGLGWMNQTNRKNIDLYAPEVGSVPTYSTNYSAGLKRADAMFDLLEADEGHKNHKKIMIFLSDGVPTLYVDLKTGKTKGNGNYLSERNVKTCKTEAEAAFSWFIGQNPNVKTYTVGVSEDLKEDNGNDQGNWSSSPAVLKYMATNGGGSYIPVGSDMSALKNKLAALFFPKQVTITDQLSAYTEIYTPQPDYKVTMIDTNNPQAQETVLYDPKNGLTDDAEGILKRVYVDPNDSKRVIAEFEPEYALEPGYKYTLSFNIKTTEQAYKEFRKSGYNATGDNLTDYLGTDPDNATSSNQPGFHSNADTDDDFTTGAYVSYVKTTDPISEPYEHPVVQVSQNKLLVQKKWMSAGEDITADQVDKSIKFQLIQIATGFVSGDKTEKVFDTYTLDGTNGWKTEIVVPLSGINEAGTEAVKYSYKVNEELANSECKTTYENNSTNGCTPGIEITGSNTIGIINTIFQLPETGGPGTTYLYFFGGILMITAVGYGYRLRSRRERRGNR